MTPYYEHAGITIYHGDCREVLAAAICGMVIWFHHEWYWIVACFIGYALITPEVKLK